MCNHTVKVYKKSSRNMLQWSKHKKTSVYFCSQGFLTLLGWLTLFIASENSRDSKDVRQSRKWRRDCPLTTGCEGLVVAAWLAAAHPDSRNAVWRIRLATPAPSSNLLVPLPNTADGGPATNGGGRCPAGSSGSAAVFIARRTQAATREHTSRQQWCDPHHGDTADHTIGRLISRNYNDDSAQYGVRTGDDDW